MPKGYPPSVFVSSTCYDLAQIRLDLKRFIEGMGFEAVISESSSFPINPQATTFENCINAVRDRADIFVLIVGLKYGSKPNGGKSITNREFLEAKSKGVPVYVFIAKEVIHNLRIWKANPDADYSAIVDDPAVFAFANELRSSSGLWAYDFNEVADIVDTLRKQWGILFTESLLFRNRLQFPTLSAELAALPPEPLLLLLERPFAWEFKLLASILKHELAKQSTLRRDIKFGLRMGGGRYFEGVGDAMVWLHRHIHRAIELAQSCAALLNDAALEAIGPVGQQGDPELIVYVGSRLGQLVRKMREWQLQLAETKVDAPLQPLLSLVSGFCDDPIAKIENLPNQTDVKVAKAEEAKAAGANPHIDLSITFGIAEGLIERLDAEFARLRQEYGIE